MEPVVVHEAEDALALLERLGAPPRLVRHHELVVEAARQIIEGLGRFASCFEARVVLLGAALHDAGKIRYPAELDGPGDLHEVAGRDLLVERGLDDLAEFCVTHAKWGDSVPLEDLLVALADKRWKGKRVDGLERRIMERLAADSGLDFWDVFVLADDVFERVAAAGDERLLRSVATRHTDC